MKFHLFLILLPFLAFALPALDWEKSTQNLEKFDLEIAEITKKEMAVMTDIIKELKDFKEHAEIETKVYARNGFCGFQLPEKIQKICGPILYTASDSNIFGVCCLHSCSDAFIKGMTCPDSEEKTKKKTNEVKNQMTSSSEESEDDHDWEEEEKEEEDDQDSEEEDD